MAMQVTVGDAGELVEDYIRAGEVAMLKGPPGLGKSTIVAEVAEKLNLKLKDVRLAQCDPTDLLGFPKIKEIRDESGNVIGERAYYVPMDTFPLEIDPIPEGYSGWLVFLDELNGADRAVQKASYKVLLDKMIGDNHIHKNVAMVAAGNLDTDGALVEELSTALQSRLVHIEVKSDFKSWLEWAERFGIDHRIRSYLKFAQRNLNTFDPNNQGDEPTYACERTWEKMHRVISSTRFKIRDRMALPKLAGVIGEGVAREFLGYLKVFKDLPDIADIIAAPNSIAVPTQPDTLYALTGQIATEADHKNIDHLVEYLDRFPKEFQVIGLKELIKVDASFIATPALSNWIANNNTKLV
jgi:hypothetical protein